ncbi:MAG: serine protease [Candidatus Paceibacterota bacterium]
MKLEELTKQQIILLALLVSFVTSIATGIVSVTLLGQTPPGVTQTVNRIFERTVEKVVPDKQGASVIMKEKTVVVKEEDLIVKSVETGSKSIVRIYERPQQQPESDLNKGNDNNNILGSFVGVGIIISSDGTISTASNNLLNWKKYMISTYDNRIFNMNVLFYGEKVSFAKAIIDEKSTEKYVFNSAILLESKNIKLGESIVAISGEDRNIISTGIVSSLVKEDAIKNKITEIETSIQPLRIEGAPVFNLFGEVIAVNIIFTQGATLIPSDFINEELKIFETENLKNQTKK